MGPADQVAAALRQERAEAATYFVITQNDGDGVHIRAAGRPGEREADQLRGLPDGSGVGVGFLLLVLLAGREPVLGADLADLGERRAGIVDVLVAGSEVVGERGDDRRVDREAAVTRSSVGPVSGANSWRKKNP